MNAKLLLLSLLMLALSCQKESVPSDANPDKPEPIDTPDDILYRTLDPPSPSAWLLESESATDKSKVESFWWSVNLNEGSEMDFEVFGLAHTNPKSNDEPDTYVTQFEYEVEGMSEGAEIALNRIEGDVNPHILTTNLVGGETLNDADWRWQKYVKLSRVNGPDEEGKRFMQIAEGNYLGVKMQIDGETHFGWIQYRFEPNNLHPLVLIDMALQMVPGKSIEIGQTE